MSQILTEQSAAVVASWLSLNHLTPTTLLRRCAAESEQNTWFSCYIFTSIYA